MNMLKNGIALLLTIMLLLFLIACEFNYSPTLSSKDNDNQNAKAKLNGPYNVIRVIDGDTFIASVDDLKLKIRLIGVDTPESVHPQKNKNCKEGLIASAYTKSLLTNKKVYLEYDVVTFDDYGRLLAYVYLDKK